MLFYATVVVTTALTLLVSLTTDAHSWADCIDWRFKKPGPQGMSGWAADAGECHGWARKFPVSANKPFGTLDSFSPNRHYHQLIGEFVPCSDGKRGNETGADETRQNPIQNAYGGKYGRMASPVKAGDTMCVRWPAKNHAKETGVNGVFINMPPAPTLKDPESQADLMKMTIAKLPYENCTHIKGDTDFTPCGGCFEIPKDRTPGDYLIQWRWELNDNEWYTSCWDVTVTASDGTVPVKILGASTSLFAQLAED